VRGEKGEVFFIEKLIHSFSNLQIFKSKTTQSPTGKWVAVDY